MICTISSGRRSSCIEQGAGWQEKGDLPGRLDLTEQCILADAVYNSTCIVNLYGM
jgi:hypothetical protein